MEKGIVNDIHSPFSFALTSPVDSIKITSVIIEGDRLWPEKKR